MANVFDAVISQSNLAIKDVVMNTQKYDVVFEGNIVLGDIIIHSLRTTHFLCSPSDIYEVNVALPAGRMRGDIDGDGLITENDVALAKTYQVNQSVNPDGLDEIQIKCCDFNGDGLVEGGNDYAQIHAIALGHYNSGWAGDIFDNWNLNPNYRTEEMKFYVDIYDGNISKQNTVALFTNHEYDDEFFSCECMDGFVRIFAKLCPIKKVMATLQFFRQYPLTEIEVCATCDIEVITTTEEG